MNPSDNQAYHRISSAAGIDARKEAKRQQNLTDQQRRTERLEQQVALLKAELAAVKTEFNRVIDGIHFSGTLGITGTARTGFMGDFPKATVECVNNVATLILSTNG